MAPIVPRAGPRAHYPRGHGFCASGGYRRVMTASPSDAGSLLRHWRSRRRMSQLELASRAQVSTRHLSFLENGRSAPTPRMLTRLADHLDIPLSARNELFLAAGFAPPHSELAFGDTGLEPVLTGLRALLDAHMPYPALLLDHAWDIVDHNDAAAAMLSACAPTITEPPVNAVLVSLHPDGLAPWIRNRDEWGAHLVDLVRRRAAAIGAPRLLEVLAEAERLLGPRAAPAEYRGPVVTLDIEWNGAVARYFTVAGQVEMPADITVGGLHVETFVPVGGFDSPTAGG